MACAAAAALLAPVAEAAFPGKPGRIAYSVGSFDEDTTLTVDGQADIYSVNPDGSDRRRLTTPAGEPDFNVGVAWSPSGSLLAFYSSFPFTPATPYPLRPESDVFTMAPSGGPRVFVTGGTSPLFFPNGIRLYSHQVDVDLLDQHVYSTRLDGSERREEPLNTYSQQGPQFSPDGRWILETASTSNDVFMRRKGTTKARNLTNTFDATESEAVFSPDGGAIAYVKRQFPPFGEPPAVVETLDLRTGVKKVVSDPSVASFDPDWGPIPVKCGGRRATLVGTPGKDRLVGTKGRDVIAGLAGSDVLIGGKGNDVLCGGKGKDKLRGGKGKDRERP